MLRHSRNTARIQGRRNQEAISKGVAAVHAVTHLNDEICNGGYVQYFVNTRGEVSDYAIKGYELLGATEQAELFKQAMSAAAEELPDELDEKSIQDLMQIVHKNHVSHGSLDQLDDKYFALNRRSNIEVICGRYIRSHPEEFPFVDINAVESPTC